MALSSSLSSPAITISSLHFSANPPNLKIPTFNFHLSSIPINGDNRNPLFVTKTRSDDKWRARVSFFPVFLRKKKDANLLKEELLNAIAPLDRGADATVEDQQRVDEIATQLEAVSPTKEPLKSNLLNGKWELIYTTSQSILQTKFALQISKFMRSRTNYQAINDDTLRAQNMDSWPFFDKRPKLLRSRTNYQAINVDTLRAQNMESWPFFNQVTADLTPLSAKKVAVQFDTFKILGLIPIKAPRRARGELETTYLDEELRISRGDKGNLFVLKMINPSYRVPV